MNRSPRRVFLICEGQTEEAIANQTIGPHLEARGLALTAWVVKTKRPATGGASRGGGSWAHYLAEIRGALRDRGAVAVTTMIDLYRYPRDGPGQPAPSGLKAVALAGHVETEMAATIADVRFIPNLLVHEVEALLFADPDRVGARAADGGVVGALLGALRSCGSPELVNDGPNTHPAARIEQAWPRFAKTTDGPSLVAAIGLSSIRQACPHFDAWLSQLENM